MPRPDWTTVVATVLVLIALAFVAKKAGIGLPKPLQD